MPWPWRRKGSDAGPSRPEAAPSRAGDDNVIRQEQAPTGDWMTLPPISTTGPIPTTFRVQTLPEILITHHNTRLSGSLGHAVSPLAPSGIVSGLAMDAGSVRPAIETGTDLPLKAPHVARVEDEAVPLERPVVSERALPTVRPEPLSVSTLPEPVVSRSLPGPLPLVSPVSGSRDLPVAQAVDAPVRTRPALVPTASTADSGSQREVSSASTSAPEAPDTPVATQDLRVGGFDPSALDDLSQDGESELLAPPPPDLAPPIQPRTLQRRLAGARPIEVPPQLRLPSSTPNPEAPTSGSTGIDLPLVTPPSGAGAAGGRDVTPPRVTAQRGAEAPEISAQRTADTSGPPPLHTPSQPAPGAGSASDQPGRQQSGVSAQRTENTGTTDTAPPTVGTLGTGDSAETGLAAATEQTDIAAQRTAETYSALPLHTPAQSTPGAGSASDQPGRERSGISAQRTEDTERSGISAQRTEDTERSGASAQRTEDTERSGISAQRTEDTGAQEAVRRTADTLGTGAVPAAAAEPTDISAQRTADTSSALPLHTPAQPPPGVGSASDQPGGERSSSSAQRTEDTERSSISAQRTEDTERSGISAQRTEDTERSGISAQRTEHTADITVPTAAPLATTASPDHLTAAGSTTQAQIGAPAASLPLAPADWQETLEAPSGRGPVGPAEGARHGVAFQRQSPSQDGPEGDVLRAPVAAGLAPALPLVASRPVGIHQPLSSLAPMVPGTTSVAQRAAAAGSAAAAPAATLARPRPASAGTVAGTASGMPHLPDVITNDVLAAPLAPASPTVAPSATPAPVGGDSPTGLPLQRSASDSGATGPAATGGGRQALPLHTPAAAIPSAADIAVTAGLAERGPGGSLRFTHLPAGADSPPGTMPIQRDSSAASPATETPAPASTPATGGGGNEIMSAEPAPGGPDATIQERAQALAEQARKLYPHIRNQLESDIRRQLEARSRAGGIR